ncbi:MAG: class I SAM-dependent methyltransferase [Ignavibacteriales bacterium]|nr:class I SAM-dependent methyltransferase [Ignavibacteriales bacterium]
MANNYFSDHYARMNGIDPGSEFSIREWLKRSEAFYASELSTYWESLEDKRILELGCGVGGFLNYVMKQHPARFLGIDSSESQLSVCRKHVTESVVRADSLDFLRMQTDQYDWIIALDMLEHVRKEDVSPLVKAIHSALAPGGKMLIRTPNMGSLFALRSRYVDFTHEVGFTEESIRQVLAENGYSSIEVHNTLIGRKRLFAITTFQRLLGMLYNISLSRIVTQNMIVVAQ